MLSNSHRLALVPLLVYVAVSSGCSTEPGANLVPNPTYQGWAAFEPGSSITLEGTRTTGGKKVSVRITNLLLEKADGQITLQRTTHVLGAQEQPPQVKTKVEPAMIEASKNPRTRPDATRTELKPESIELNGQTFICNCLQVAVHVEYGEPLPSVEDVRLRTWTNPAIPGGTARLEISRQSSTHEMQLSLRAIGFKALGGPKP